jgi:hypothetical protein
MSTNRKVFEYFNSFRNGHLLLIEKPTVHSPFPCHNLCLGTLIQFIKNFFGNSAEAINYNEAFYALCWQFLAGKFGKLGSFC